MNDIEIHTICRIKVKQNRNVKSLKFNYTETPKGEK